MLTPILRVKPDCSKTSWKAKMVRRRISKPWARNLGIWIAIYVYVLSFRVPDPNHICHDLKGIVPHTSMQRSYFHNRPWKQLEKRKQCSVSADCALCVCWYCTGKDKVFAELIHHERSWSSTSSLQTQWSAFRDLPNPSENRKKLASDYPNEMRQMLRLLFFLRIGATRDTRRKGLEVDVATNVRVQQSAWDLSTKATWKKHPICKFSVYMIRWKCMKRNMHRWTW